MKKFFDEFKEFISRGNVMDMAVGVIVGGAFGAITSSLVTNVGRSSSRAMAKARTVCFFGR